MPGAVLVRAGPIVHWVVPGRGVVRSVPVGPSARDAARAILHRFSDGLPEDVRRGLGSDPPIGCTDPVLSEALVRIGTDLPPPSLATVRAVRESAPSPAPAEERAFALALARLSLEEALRSPEEMLISLAREEERVERAIRREGGAAEQFLVAPDSPVSEYLGEWASFRERFAEHHAHLVERLERAAEEVAPNLSAVVGPRVAARLIAYASGLPALARMPSSRLQLLGSRRRPSPTRGPRFGLLFRAARMADVPADRQGAYARSLAALAAIAARADATTHARIATPLAARRDRRIERLRRRRAP